MSKLTARQEQILTLIIDEYIKTGQPISSLELLEKHNLDFSSATIRNEMVFLEEEGFLSKSHHASGRIPTNKSYKWYLDDIQTNTDQYLSIKKKIELLFAKRNKNIDLVIEETIKLINSVSNTTSITTEEHNNAFLEDLKLYKIEDRTAMLLIVLSNGKVVNNDISLSKINFEDLRTAVDIFAQRLKGTNISQILTTAKSLEKLISQEVKTLEDKFKDIIFILFNNLELKKHKYVGLNNIVSGNYLSTMEGVKKLMELVETNTIWKVIDNKKTISSSNVDVNLELADKELENVSIISKKINLGNTQKHLTLIGPKRQDYKTMFTLLGVLDDNLKKWQKESDDEKK